jgi:hypothetical protein
MKMLTKKEIREIDKKVKHGATREIAREFIYNKFQSYTSLILTLKFSTQFC